MPKSLIGSEPGEPPNGRIPDQADAEAEAVSSEQPAKVQGVGQARPEEVADDECEPSQHGGGHTDAGAHAEKAGGIARQISVLGGPESSDSQGAKTEAGAAETATEAAEQSDADQPPEGSPFARLKETIKTPPAAAEDADWHRIIIREHQEKDALVILDSIYGCRADNLADADAYLEAVRAAHKADKLRYPARLLRAVLTGLAQEIGNQLVLPGVFLPPTDLLSALFAAAELGEHSRAS